MHVATLIVTLYLPEGSSLKDKRQVIKGLIEGVRRRFNVSAAEIGDLDLWRRAEIGFGVVSNDARHANSSLDKLLDYLESRPEIEVGEVQIEVL